MTQTENTEVSNFFFTFNIKVGNRTINKTLDPDMGKAKLSDTIDKLVEDIDTEDSIFLREYINSQIYSNLQIAIRYHLSRSNVEEMDWELIRKKLRQLQWVRTMESKEIDEFNAIYGKVVSVTLGKDGKVILAFISKGKLMVHKEEEVILEYEMPLPE